MIVASSVARVQLKATSPLILSSLYHVDVLSNCLYSNVQLFLWGVFFIVASLLAVLRLFSVVVGLFVWLLFFLSQ